SGAAGGAGTSAGVTVVLDRGAASSAGAAGVSTVRDVLARGAVPSPSRGAAAGTGRAFSRGGAVAVRVVVATPEVPARVPPSPLLAKYCRQLTSTLAGSVRNCWYFSSTNQSLGPNS